MEPEHSRHALGTDARSVPMTKAPDPHSGERAALTWITEALNHQRMVGDKGLTRENSLAVTKLQEAKFWAEQDLENKENSSTEDKLKEQLRG